jgi:hypothetical protein
MECVVYKRRIVLGGIASATILASGVLTAGTALAATTSQLPVALPATASSLIPVGPMSQAPGLAGALLAVPVRSSLTGGAASVSGAILKSSDVTGAIPGVSGLTGAAQGVLPANLAQLGLGNVTMPGSAIGQGVTGGTGNVLPVVGSVPSLGNATGAVSNITGNLGSVTSEIPALGGLTGAVARP